MRTLLQKTVHGLRNQLGLNARRIYTIEGTITFIFNSASYEPDLNELRKLIIMADAHYPWMEKDHLGEEVKSIRFLSKGNIGINDFQIPEKFCWFNIHPGIGNINKGQIHAYEKYLGKIIDVLAGEKFPHVVLVRCVVTTHIALESSVVK